MNLINLFILIVFVYIDMYETYEKNLKAPKDNSHYKDGVSRYIWLGDDGSGELQLVDLWERVEEDNCTADGNKKYAYYLYTKRNIDSPDRIDYNMNETILSSHYDATLPLNVFTHGWNGNKDSKSVTTVRDAFLNASDCNVIVFEWKCDANNKYSTSAKRTRRVGKALGKFITWLMESAGGSLNRTHLVGFSLGAHVVGNARRTLSGKVKRVTGLDPAGPLFNSLLRDIRIGKKAGQYVEIIHTDAGVTGLISRAGHVDFYANGGRRPQPGCSVLSRRCSHDKAVQYFAASISYKGKLFGKKCENIAQALLDKCEGELLKMGSDDLDKSGRGIYGLKTTEEWPYDDNDIATEVNEDNFYF